ncbi:M20/M25/M40 family metallo-hydrolase [Thermophilibacter provencensis]|uniref:M20/M25/M40 family metallo-hydrolase n=1 Tax=Thermophilibacter provencensis TaxID=1852386 RepID=A0A921GH70_9ACTN|nr:M20/M25/M40 family metallo-hydrolase [Thermophilibacter provencensis]HJF46191.1 M20/M25/M40 family metallo-hydrolase [Thermophilibacter provencensis]
MNEKIKQLATAYADECHEEELELLRTLAQIPAPSGHEERRAEFIRDWLLAQGAPVGSVRIDDAKNVILSLPAGAGAADDGIAVFAAHTDVVFPDTEPLPLAESATRLLAPGVGDDTANLVGLLLAARYLMRNRIALDRPLLVVANSCEEGLGNLAGTRELFRQYAGRVREFTSFDLYLGMHVVSAVGSHRWRVMCHTQGGHSWENFGRDNAIEELCSLIEDLYAMELPTAAKTTINVGRFEGGTTVNSIAEDASVLVEYRSASEECLELMYGKFVGLVEEHLRKGSRIDVKLIGRRPASGERIPAGQGELIARTDEVLRELGGVTPIHQESSTDANIPLSLGVCAHTVGTVEGDLLHTREEWIEKDSLRRGLAVILALMLAHATDVGSH